MGGPVRVVRAAVVRDVPQKGPQQDVRPCFPGGDGELAGLLAECQALIAQRRLETFELEAELGLSPRMQEPMADPAAEPPPAPGRPTPAQPGSPAPRSDRAAGAPRASSAAAAADPGDRCGTAAAADPGDGGAEEGRCLSAARSGLRAASPRRPRSPRADSPPAAGAARSAARPPGAAPAHLRPVRGGAGRAGGRPSPRRPSPARPQGAAVAAVAERRLAAAARRGAVPPEEWPVEDVGRYLGEELNLPALGQLFVKHHVGGQELLDLTEEHLEGTFGIRNFLLREHIMRSVAKLRLRRALAARSRSQHPAHAAGDHLSRTCARRPEASQGGSPRLAGSAPSSPACARRGALRPAERPDADADAPPAVSRGHAEEAPSAAGEAAGACAAAGVGGCVAAARRQASPCESAAAAAAWPLARVAGGWEAAVLRAPPSPAAVYQVGQQVLVLGPAAARLPPRAAPPLAPAAARPLGAGALPGRTWCTPPQHRVTITQ